MGKNLSSCHLNKQRLINPLEAQVNESARPIESTGTTSPYKISRFHGKASGRCFLAIMGAIAQMERELKAERAAAGRAAASAGRTGAASH